MEFLYKFNLTTIITLKCERNGITEFIYFETFNHSSDTFFYHSNVGDFYIRIYQIKVRANQNFTHKLL